LSEDSKPKLKVDDLFRLPLPFYGFSHIPVTLITKYYYSSIFLILACIFFPPVNFAFAFSTYPSFSKQMKVVAALLVALLAVASAQWVEPLLHHPHISDEKLAKLMNMPQPLSREQSNPSFPFFMTWKNCGSNTDLVQVNTLTVTPDPIVLGANITAQASITLSTKLLPFDRSIQPTNDCILEQALDQSLFSSVSLVIAKKAFGFYLQIPCMFDWPIRGLHLANLLTMPSRH